MFETFGQVYLISEGERGPCKIGVTVAAHVRVATMQVGNPRKLKFHGVVNHSEPYLLERALHHHFKGSRIIGEWFAITVKQAKRAMEIFETKDSGALRKITGSGPIIHKRPIALAVQRPKRKVGRPKLHASAADRQRASRARKKAKA